MDKNILRVGIDVSKDHLDVALTLDGEKIISTKTVNNNLSGFNALEKWFRKYANKNLCEKIHVCIESTGIYSDDIADYLYEKYEYSVSVVNPMQTKAFAKSIMLRTKTDKVDAKLLAIYCTTGNPRVTTKAPVDMRLFKKLVRHYNYLIQRRAQEKSHLESVKDSAIRDSILNVISFYDQEIEKTKMVIGKHIDKHNKIKDNLDLLQSIPGIGSTTAQTLLSELHNEGANDKYKAKSQTAHSGLAPREFKSGKSVNGKPRICKIGNPRLRKSLFFPALTAIRYNIVISEFYNRLLDRGKPKKLAVTAAMRKLLVIAIGVLNNQKAFDEKWNEKQQYTRKFA